MEPSATSVSMFGARCHRLLKSADKELLVDHHDDTCKKQLYQPHGYMIIRQTHAGSGQPHIICPMEKYISTSKKPTDAISRLFQHRCFVIFQRFLRCRKQKPAAPAAPFKDAPYPASCTAVIISPEVASSFHTHGIGQQAD